MAAPTPPPAASTTAATDQLATAYSVAPYPAWEEALLIQMGAPLTDGNLQALAFWNQSEGMGGTNNPLAISGKYPGATTCLTQCDGSSPVYAYDTIDNGVAATNAFLQGSYYTGVVKAFQQDAGITSIWQSINNSPWCTGCEGGKYPSVLFSALNNPTSILSSAIANANAVTSGAQAAVSGLTASGAAAGSATTGTETIGFNPLDPTGVGAAVSSVPAFLGKITNLGWWKRAALVGLGIGFVGVGLVVFFEGTDTGQKITKDAVEAAGQAAGQAALA